MVPGLRVVEYTPTSTRIFGDFAVEAGRYTFAWENADGSTTEVTARFNFTFRKEADNWMIIHHHSSAMPAAPPALKSVRGSGPPPASVVLVGVCRGYLPRPARFCFLWLPESGSTS